MTHCIFCGKTRARVHREESNPTMPFLGTEEFYVWCPDCKAQGPVTAVSGEEALRRWNARGGFDGDRPRLIDLLSLFDYRAEDHDPYRTEARWEELCPTGMDSDPLDLATTRMLELREMIRAGVFEDYRPEAP